jgi:transposase InsO family protein
VDHSTNYVFVVMQVHQNSHETLQAKNVFEPFCHEAGVVVQEYLADNGPAFSSKAFADHLAEYRQVIHFAGVGAHHSNGIAEAAIKRVMSIAEP